MADHLQLGMDRKWQRHYRETSSLLSVSMIIFGVVVFIPLSFIWPQVIAPMMFNTRLEFQKIGKRFINHFFFFIIFFEYSKFVFFYVHFI